MLNFLNKQFPKYVTLTIGVINNMANPMPPDGSVQLTDCEKLKIENWISNGYEAAQ